MAPHTVEPHDPTPTPRAKSFTTRKIAAIAAGVLVVGVGATYTLASWNDSEWVWGGADGVTTAEFNIQQDTTVGFANDAWVDEPNNRGGALTFSPGSVDLVPGDTIYAPVALRADEDSATAYVTLLQAVAATGPTADDPDNSLWNAVEVEVYTADSTNSANNFPRVDACSAADLEGSNWWSKVAGVDSLGTAATANQTLVAAAGSVQHYCFVLSLPDDASADLQGRSIFPAWEFKASSTNEVTTKA